MITITSLLTYITIAAVLLTALFAFGLKKKPEDTLGWVLMFLANWAGSLFIFSGLVKAIDPKGTAYKMEQYFAEFETVFASPLSGIFPFVAQFALAFSIIFIVLEFVLGVNLIFGIKKKLTAWLFLGVVVFFTILTGFTFLSAYSPSSMAFMLMVTAFIGFGLAAYLTENKKLRIAFGVLGLIFPAIIVNLFMDKGFTFGGFGDWDYVKSDMKVTDCGCFGDFLKLKPMVSFFKDLFLLPPAILFVIFHTKMKSILSEKMEWVALGGVTLLSLLFCFQNSLWNLPMADFRPFHEGQNLPEAKAEAMADKDIVERYFVYKNKNSGEEKEIKSDELSNHRYLWESGEWDIQKDKTRNIVLKEGSDSKLKDFEFTDDQGTEMADQLTSDPNYNFMIVAYQLYKTNKNAWIKKVNGVAEGAKKDGLNVYALTGAASKETEDFRHNFQTAFPFYSADDILLKTIVRSNPGVVLMKNGVIIKKWHYKKLPSYETIKSKYMK